MPLLNFLESDFPDFKYIGSGKLEKRISLHRAQIDFDLLQEALHHTDLTVTYANKELGILKLKEELKVFKNSNAMAIQISDDEIVLRCYSFSGRKQKDTKRLCEEMLPLLEVFKMPNPILVAV